MRTIKRITLCIYQKNIAVMPNAPSSDDLFHVFMMLIDLSLIEKRRHSQSVAQILNPPPLI